MREYVIIFGIVAAFFAIATLVYVWVSLFMESRETVTYSLIGTGGKKKKKSNDKDLTWLWIAAGVLGITALGVIGAKRHAAKKRKKREQRVLGLWML